MAPPAEAPLQHQSNHRRGEGRPRPSPRISVRLEKAQLYLRTCLGRSAGQRAAGVSIDGLSGCENAAIPPTCRTPSGRWSGRCCRCRAGCGAGAANRKRTATARYWTRSATSSTTAQSGGPCRPTSRRATGSTHSFDAGATASSSRRSTTGSAAEVRQLAGRDSDSRGCRPAVLADRLLRLRRRPGRCGRGPGAAGRGGRRGRDPAVRAGLRLGAHERGGFVRGHGEGPRRPRPPPGPHTAARPRTHEPPAPRRPHEADLVRYLRAGSVLAATTSRVHDALSAGKELIGGAPARGEEVCCGFEAGGAVRGTCTGMAREQIQWRSSCNGQGRSWTGTRR